MSMQGSPKAICVKMQLLGDNKLIPLPGPDDGKVVITLNEVDPKDDEFEAANDDDGQKKGSRAVRRRYRRVYDGVEVGFDALHRRDEPSDSCHCQWKNS